MFQFLSRLRWDLCINNVKVLRLALLLAVFLRKFNRLGTIPDMRDSLAFPFQSMLKCWPIFNSKMTKILDFNFFYWLFVTTFGWTFFSFFLKNSHVTENRCFWTIDASEVLHLNECCGCWIWLTFHGPNYVLKLTYKLYRPKLNRRDIIPRNSCCMLCIKFLWFSFHNS